MTAVVFVGGPLHGERHNVPADPLRRWTVPAYTDRSGGLFGALMGTVTYTLDHVVIADEVYEVGYPLGERPVLVSVVDERELDLTGKRGAVKMLHDSTTMRTTFLVTPDLAASLGWSA